MWKRHFISVFISEDTAKTIVKGAEKLTFTQILKMPGWSENCYTHVVFRRLESLLDNTKVGIDMIGNVCIWTYNKNCHSHLYAFYQEQEENCCQWKLKTNVCMCNVHVCVYLCVQNLHIGFICFTGNITWPCKSLFIFS